jgi:phospholipid transport system transporter-binding protein
MGARKERSAAGSKLPDSVPEPLIDLGKSCGIRQGAALKQQLLEVLEAPGAVVIDPRAIERIDTAALQLLYAFERDRLAAGRSVTWRAPSPAFTQAMTTLGLKLGAAAPAVA